MLDYNTIALLVSAIVLYLIFYFIPDKKKIKKTKNNNVVKTIFEVVDVDFTIDDTTTKELKTLGKRFSTKPISDRIKKLLSIYVKNDKELMFNCDDSIYKIASMSIVYLFSTLKNGKSNERKYLLEKYTNLLEGKCEFVTNKDDSVSIAIPSDIANKSISLLKRTSDEVIVSISFTNKVNIDNNVIEEGFNIKITMGSL